MIKEDSEQIGPVWRWRDPSHLPQRGFSSSYPMNVGEQPLVPTVPSTFWTPGILIGAGAVENEET